jgi:glycosyltransferase involved in cell wall biosynthesis
MAQAQHILICLHDFNRGGTERIALGMARSWLDVGRKVTILCGARLGGLEDSVDPRVEVVELEPPLPRGLTSRLRLGRAMAPYVARISPDVIFLPGNFHFPLVPALSRVRGRAALVAKISNPAVPSGVVAPLVRWLFRRHAHQLDGLAAMNSGLEREIRAIVPDFNVTTLYDPVYWKADEAPALPAAGERLEILWAGRFEPQKDAGLALRTLVALNKLAPARLTMLGEGYLRPKMARMAQRLGLGEDKLVMRGHVPAIDPFLRESHALFVSSVFEGGPAVAVEALAHGVPVVSTDCSHFLRDVIEREDAGRIVSGRRPADLAAALVAVAGRKPPALFAPLVERFAPQVCADAYLAWFDGMVR